MQGKFPLPMRIVEKYAKTGGELCKNVFLLGEHSFTALMTRCVDDLLKGSLV